MVAAVPYVANITGTYAAYLKHWDARALKDFAPAPLPVGDGPAGVCYQTDAVELLQTVSGAVLYADPPYNGRQYLPNYHVLETVARYDAPEVRGVTGQRPNLAPSAFCRRSEAADALHALFDAAQFEHVLLSYNSEGLVGADTIRDLLCDVGDPASFERRDVAYRRYKSQAAGGDTELVEYLFYVRKPQ